MSDKLYPFVEWAAWASLDSKTNLETLMLKGHLFLEVMLDSVLELKNIEVYPNFSFRRKVSLLDNINTLDKEKWNEIIKALVDLNWLRNKLAHDYFFDIHNGELESWASYILSNFEVTKYTRQTYRTKIVHAFSTIAGSMYELGESV